MLEIRNRILSWRQNQPNYHRKIRQYKSQRGSFQKLITDNEYKSINIKDYLRNENINLHLAKSNNHTGNADIERLHSTISEKIRTLRIESNQLSIKEKISKAIEWYNNSYHSTTKEKPIDIEEGKANKKKVYENLIKEKTKVYIEKQKFKQRGLWRK